MLQESFQLSWVVCKDGDEFLRVGLGWRKERGKMASEQASKVIPAIPNCFPRSHPETWSLPITPAFRTGPIVSTKSFQQLRCLLWYVVHEDLAIALHVTLCLLKRKLTNILKGFLIVLWRGKGKLLLFLSHPAGCIFSIPVCSQSSTLPKARTAPTLISSSWIFKYHS